MNKTLIFTVLVLFQAGIIFGQKSEVQKCGLNNEPNITKNEAKYFNEVFKDKRGEFDFTEKVIAFFTGSSGTTKSNKSNYFNRLKNENNGENDIHAWQAKGTQLLILTDKEKEISGGYDVILVSWSKFLKEGKSRNKLVKRLKNTLLNKT